MGKEILKYEGKEVTQVAAEIINCIKRNWKDKTVYREYTGGRECYCIKTRKKMIHPEIMKKEVVVPSSIKRLNKGVSFTELQVFANSVKPDDKNQIIRLIKSGTFEVEKATQVFVNAPLVAVDVSIQPSSWDEAYELNSPSFATCEKYKGREKTIDLVHLLTMNFAKKFGKRNDLGESEIYQLSKELVIRFKNLTIADLKMIYNNALNVSKQRFNLDYQGVLSIVNSEYENRFIHYSEKQQQEHLNITYEEKQGRERKEKGGSIVTENMSIDEQLKQMKVLIDKKVIIKESDKQMFQPDSK